MNPKILTVFILFLLAASVYALVITRLSTPPEVAPAEQATPQRGDAGVVDADGWVVIESDENGDKVYWFVAPDVAGSSPGMFKKTISQGAEGREVTIVSECEAPKATCDRLQQNFEALSAQYN